MPSNIEDKCFNCGQDRHIHAVDGTCPHLLTIEGTHLELKQEVWRIGNLLTSTETKTDGEKMTMIFTREEWNRYCEIISRLRMMVD